MHALPRHPAMAVKWLTMMVVILQNNIIMDLKILFIVELITALFGPFNLSFFATFD